MNAVEIEQALSELALRLEKLFELYTKMTAVAARTKPDAKAVRRRSAA